MSGSFFVGFSGVFRPFTILYTRARDGAPSRPTGFLFHWSRCLVVTNKIFTATNGISVVTNGISGATNGIFARRLAQNTNPKTFRFCIYYSMVQNFCVVP
jgi:hypothetical protein